MKAEEAVEIFSNRLKVVCLKFSSWISFSSLKKKPFKRVLYKFNYIRLTLLVLFCDFFFNLQHFYVNYFLYPGWFKVIYKCFEICCLSIFTIVFFLLSMIKFDLQKFFLMLLDFFWKKIVSRRSKILKIKFILIILNKIIVFIIGFVIGPL